ncbi:MAG: hypothetical protein Q8O13_05320 [Candidatus Omnitrophota bacterium]|nr:hypothetical protein [Candidatus Omnitrophota bacterium]
MWKRILITCLFLTLYWIGRFIPVPGVNYGILKSLVSMPDMGGFEQIMHRVSIFSLDIVPYVSIHIIFMLLIAILPSLRNILENETLGIRKINQLIYAGVIFLGLVQSLFLTLWIEKLHTADGVYLVNSPTVVFRLVSMLSITVGVLIIIWMAEQINKHGIGNGISLFFLSGLLVKMRSPLLKFLEELVTLNQLKVIIAGLLLILSLVIIILMLRREKKVPVVFSSEKTKNITMSIPLNLPGIIPIYFAHSILLFPATINALGGEQASPILSWITTILIHGTWISYLSWVILIIFFSYFYTVVVFNPLEVISKMKRFRLSIEGAVTEKTAAEYIGRVMARNIVLIWSIFLCGVAFLPVFLYRLLKIHIPFAGVEVVLLVGITLRILSSLQNRKSLREVFRHSDIKDILIIKTRLESEGISVVVDDCEGYVRLLSLMVGPLSEKKLLVDERDYDKSISLVK